MKEDPPVHGLLTLRPCRSCLLPGVPPSESDIEGVFRPCIPPTFIRHLLFAEPQVKQETRETPVSLALRPGGADGP